MNFCLLLALIAFQKQDQANIEERFQVDYVLLDVAVVDRKGKPIKDLKLSDFVIKENKKEVTPTFFEILDYTDVIGESQNTTITDTVTTETDVKEVKEKPVQQIIVAMDFESVPVREINKVFAQMEQFFDSLDDRLNYKINLYALDRGSLTKGFTDRVEDAKSALARYRDVFQRGRYRQEAFDSDIPGMGTANRPRSRGFMGGRRGGGRLSTMDSDWADFSDLEEAFGECLNYGIGGGGRADSRACQCLGDTLNEYLEQHKLRSERVIGELEILTYKFEENNDLKTMLLVSPGFVLYRLSAAFKLYDAFKARARCEGYRSSPLAGSLELDADFNRVVHACIKNRVIFHTFDVFNGNKANNRSFGAEFRNSPGVGVGQAYRDYGNQVVEGLRELAQESGGTFRQVFRLEGALNKAIEESRHFYVIGYNSPAGKKGKFRKIKIKVKRKGAKVRHRKGYFGS